MGKRIVSASAVLAAELDDPEFKQAWEETSLARAVALEVVSYRAKNSFSQAALAKRLGVSQPVVARLELGEHTPTWETLERLSRELGKRFVVDIDPTKGAHLRRVS